MPAASEAARRSPLMGRRVNAGEFVALVEAPPRGQIGLRGDPEDAAFVSGIKNAIGLRLPTLPNTTLSAHGISALWLGPDEWLIQTPPVRAERVANDLCQALKGAHAAVVDLTHARMVIRISGAKSRDVLAKGCPLDLHPRVFAASAGAQSLLAKASIILHAVDAEGSFDIFVARSYAEYLWDWLADAMIEFGS